MGNFMKKLFVLSILGLISCAPINNEKNNSTINDTVEVPLLNGIGNDKIAIDIIKFKYNNHHYIYFRPYMSLNASTIVHDPDCPCNKNNSM